MEFSGEYWLKLGIGIAEKLVVGIILIFIGLAFYKRTKRRQTIADAVIQKEIKQKAAVNEFKRMRNKYSKPLAENSFSTQVEQESSNLYGMCADIESHCKAFDLELESDFRLLMNYIWAYKGVLFCNNVSAIENEQIPYFIQIQKSDLQFNKEGSRKFFFENYEFFQNEIDSKISSGKFLRKFW